MTQTIVVWDTSQQCLVNSGKTITAFTDYDLDVAVGGITSWSSGFVWTGKTIDLFINGVLKRLGSSFDFTVTYPGTINFTSTIPQYAWVRVRVYG